MAAASTHSTTASVVASDASITVTPAARHIACAGTCPPCHQWAMAATRTVPTVFSTSVVISVAPMPFSERIPSAPRISAISASAGSGSARVPADVTVANARRRASFSAFM